ncbi:MAG: Lsr2 family protein [Actinomycetota bacterium]|nr:Lsr2 family protein [Actinomycetota bacterium]
MAKTLIVQLTCDRCKAETGETVEGSETVTFGYDGYSYSLDLCARHAEDFHNSTQGLIGWSSDRSRIAGTRRARAATSDAPTAEPSTARRSAGDRDRLKGIREWARKNGHPNLSERGRIPQGILDEFEAAAN